mmetsp:Transcript_42855/g.113125  ORF Transcript_42855/g.113125 Transcript_42855/m.113125 type:complete len:204 (-) Transcript_42855:1-612(-)
MSILPILGCMRSFCLPLSFFAFSFSMTDARIRSMPVAAMNSGSWKGGFSTPRLPIKNFRFWHQCFGTGIALRYDLRCTSSRGSAAVTSHCSTTSGLVTSCLSSATERRLSFFFCFFDIFASSSSSSSSAPSSSAPLSFFSSASPSAAPPLPSSSSAVLNLPNTSASSASAGVSAKSSRTDTYSTSTPSSMAYAVMGVTASAGG